MVDTKVGDPWVLSSQTGIVPTDQIQDLMDPEYPNKSIVYMVGRSGRTIGTLNELPADIRMDYGFQGDPTVNKPVLGKVLLVVLPKVTRQLRQGSLIHMVAFGTHGDSGAVVHDYQGRRMGVYLGRQGEAKHGYPAPSYIAGIHFITPFDDAMRDLEAALQCDPAMAGKEVHIDTEW